MAKTKNLIKLNLAIALLFICFVCSSQTKEEIIKQNFINAKNEIEAMLSGKVPLDYERAVFITENAFYENRISYKDFLAEINFHTKNVNSLAKQIYSLNNFKIKKNILVSKDSAAVNIYKLCINNAIFKYITDTTYFITDKDIFVHPSFAYIFSDPFATKDWSTSHVMNLLDYDMQGGNCNALTSFFKILSLRLNSNAILCTAPNHIFIRHANENGIFYNVELASKSFPGTGSIETITHTSDEAARSGIAMRELNLKQSIGLLLINLAKGYEYKLNSKSDDFIIECAELCLKYDNLNLNAMLLKAEFLNDKIVNSNKTVLELQNNSDFISYENQIKSLYIFGYREMPVEMKNKIVSALMQDTSYILFSSNKTYNPFLNSYKNYNRSFSLSNGLFEEVNTSKPKEKYFNAVFDTKKRRITEFVKEDILYNKYEFDPVVFALSVDPMVNKFASISPYSFADNNPIWKLDRDGDSTRYYSEAGVLLHNSNDNLANAFVIVNDKNINDFMIWKKAADKYKVGSNPGYNEKLRKMGISYSMDMLKQFHNKYKDIKYKDPNSGKTTDYNTEHGTLLFQENGKAKLGGYVLSQKDGNNPETVQWNQYPESTEGTIGNIHTHDNEGKPSYFEPFSGNYMYGPSGPDAAKANSATFEGKTNIVISSDNIYLYGSKMKEPVQINPNNFGKSGTTVEKK